MRFPATCLLAVFLLAAAGGAPAPAAEPPGPAVAERVETLLRDWLASDPGPRATLPAYGAARLLEFRLLDLAPLGPERWSPDVALLFDFGEPARPTAGYRRLRAGRYLLVIGVRDGTLALVRFTPRSDLRLLPSAN